MMLKSNINTIKYEYYALSNPHIYLYNFNLFSHYDKVYNS